ncbi:MAG: VWA domain-containing protein [Sulfurimonas sp.]|uniref:VWA domain-containing protein n=1 Tax=Sulfurimonas sp. TaxID=2022749 RepID=UPI002623490F|nr:VWA domain-containing protein [Sulfurimonas sp.]MDD2651592.1 VWA domain-containing protein [Sulfurimonas sp.]MDD3451403.1 VWA domain-containing protein [Sulfurimonas sp.]
MTFLHPEFLYYMLPPLFLLFAFLLTQKEHQAEFFSKDVMEKLRVSANTLTLKARNALFLIVGFFTVIALAQPVVKEGKVEVKAKSTDITIALDISDSMLAQDVYPNRLEAAKQKALTLLEEAKNERIGVVAFAKESYLVSPLSFDTAAVAFLLSQLDTSSITEKGTDFLSLLDVVQKSQKEQDRKVVLLLSDGGDKDDFSQEIAFAKKHGIVVFVLGMGTKKGAPIRLQDGTFLQHNGEMLFTKLNDAIATLATKTGGVYIEGTTSFEDIKMMFREIVRMDEKKELKSQEIERTKPLFYYPLGIAMFLLLIATSSFGRRESLFIALFFLTFHQDANAGMFDFMKLHEAKKAYESGEFDKAAQLYEAHATKSQNPQSHYNTANAYYKQGKYKEAAESYKKAAFEEGESKAKNLSNLGNAYAKSGDLQKALTSYEESLKIKEEKETRENLETVKKALQKQEQKEEQPQEEQNSKDNGQKQEKEKSSRNKDEQNKSNQTDNSQEQKESQGKQKQEDAKEPKEKKEEQKATDTKKDDKQEQNSDVSEAKTQDENGMNEAEERKWIEMLNKNVSSYMYKLSDETTQKSSNEKPW